MWGRWEWRQAGSYPPEVAASIAVPTVEAALERNQIVRRVLFVFQTRTILHDYLTHSSNSDGRATVTASLREEIARHLRTADSSELAAALDAIDDPATLRIIDDKARAILFALDGGDHHTQSVGISTIYRRAVAEMLQLGPERNRPVEG